MDLLEACAGTIIKTTPNLELVKELRKDRKPDKQDLQIESRHFSEHEQHI